MVLSLGSLYDTLGKDSWPSDHSKDITWGPKWLDGFLRRIRQVV